jgi:hypothetical protein
VVKRELARQLASFLLLGVKRRLQLKWRGELCEPFVPASQSSALRGCMRPAEVRDGEGCTLKSDEDGSHRTSCKIHGNRLADFRETLEVRTRRRVAFNQDVALDSVYIPKVPPECTKPVRHFDAGRLKKSKSFAFSAVHFFKYHLNLNKMNIQPATFRKILLPLAIATVFVGIFPSSVVAQLANINPIKDNTLYQYDPAQGDVSNALGNHFFAGETGMGELRRGVLAFNIAGNIPAGSTILGVTLSLNVSRTGVDDARNVELHKMLADWGEGTSVAPGEEGTGAPATTNDATWRHRFFDTIFWTTEGGDFSATVSASQSVGPVGVYTWSSSQMRADVQSWLDDPASNFGWLVLGDESEILTAKRFDTRESASPPVLSIIYRPAGPRPTPTPRPRPTPACGRVHCGPPPPHPAPSAFSHPLLFLSRLFALLPAAQSALPVDD